MINLLHSTDWTQVPVALVTPAGVKHAEKRVLDEKLPHIIMYGPSNWHQCYHIEKKDGYLSYKRYAVPQNWRVGDFKKSCADGKAYLRENLVWYNTDESKRFRGEIRFYEDNTISLVFQGPAESILDNIRPADRHKITEEIVTVVPDDWHYLNFNRTPASPGHQFLVVTSDEEIKEKGFKLLCKDAACFTSTFFSKGDSDLDSGKISNPNASGEVPCYWHTLNTITTFFATFKHAYKVNRATKKTGRSMQAAWDIPYYLSAPDAPATTAKNKEDIANELIAPVKAEWDKKDGKTMYWYREGDYVCAIAPGTESYSRWGYDSECRKLLAYNVKTKKRLYGTQNSDGVWTFPIPSSKYIANAMCTYLETGDPDDHLKKAGANKSVILGGLTINELFKDTNVGWFLDHADDTTIYCDHPYNKWWGSTIYTSVYTRPTKSLFTKDYIDTLALIMLCTTGTPHIEQFLKSCLFNLYFLSIEDLISDGRSFVALSKKNNYSYRYGGDSSIYLWYDEKGKNLKQMFGVSLNFLRALDKYLQPRNIITRFCWDSSKGYTPRMEFSRPVLQLGGIKEAFGDKLNTLDENTLKLVIETSNCIQAEADYIKDLRGKYARYYYGDSFWIRAKQVFDALPECDIKQKIIYVRRYQPAIGEFADYLKMRETLKNLQEENPGVPGIYSEDLFPVKIGNCRKFIPWTESEEAKCTKKTYGGYHSVSSSIAWKVADVHPQVKYYNSLYYNGELYNNGLISPYIDECFDEDGHHSGVILNMDPAVHLTYLHNQIQFWFNFYQDPKQSELFREAVKRVKDLEYVDKDSGLEIIAPKSVEDLQNEGLVLNHCVSSFVQPIIDNVTNVMFIRRSDMKDKPYFTLELCDGKIRQVQCYNNGNLDKDGQRKAYADSGSPVYNKFFDIIEFLKHWAKASRGAVSEAGLKTSYISMRATAGATT